MTPDRPVAAADAPIPAGVPWWRRWRTTLLGAFALAALPLGALEIADVATSYGRAERRVLDLQADAARGVASAVELLLARFSGIAEAAAYSIFETPLSQRERHALLARILGAHPDVNGIAVLSPEGRVIDAVPAAGVGLDVSDHFAFRQIRAGASSAVGDVGPARPSGGPVVSIAAAGRGPDGRLTGAVSIVIPAETMARVLEPHVIGDVRPFVADRSGRVIAHTGAPDLPEQARDFSRVPLVAEALATRLPRAGRLSSPVDGATKLGTVVPVPAGGWVAGVVEPLESVQAPARAALAGALTRMALVAALALGLALLLARWLYRPIGALADGVAAIARGDLAHRVPRVGRRDETARLAELFNAMADRLEGTVAALSESEARFRTMADTAPVLIWVSGPDARCAWVNRPWLEFTGRAMEEELGDGWAEGVHADDVARCLEAYRAAFEARRPFRRDYRLRRADGEWRWLLDSGVPRFDADGTFAGYIGSAFDITEIRAAETARAELLERERAARAEAEAAQRRAAFLAESGTLVASTLDVETAIARLVRLAVPDLADWCVINVVEPDGAIRSLALAHADPAREPLAREFLRYPPLPGSPHPIFEVLRSGRPALFAEVDAAGRARSARDPEHLRILETLGLASSMIVPLVARGRTLGAISFTRATPGRPYGPADLELAAELARRAALAVDNARLFREAQEAAEAARAAAEAREAFLARASHELRTPLTSALGTVRMLRKLATGSLPEPLAGLLEVASRNLGAMADLINDLLDVSKLVAGRELLAREPVDLAAAVRSSLEVVAAQAREKGLALRTNLPAGLVLRADPMKLEQVLVNLLANAVKFTPAGGEVTVEATVEGHDVAASGGDVLIRVRDTGEGIRREHLEAIFEPFVQTGPRGPRQPRGTGLGLAICRQIVHLHGGTIHAESAGPGHGSTFVVRLPGRPRREKAA